MFKSKMVSYMGGKTGKVCTVVTSFSVAKSIPRLPRRMLVRWTFKFIGTDYWCEMFLM